MLSDEWLSRYGLLENFNASVTRTRTGTRTGTGTGTGTWTTGVTAIALCTSCSRAKKGHKLAMQKTTGQLFYHEECVYEISKPKHSPFKSFKFHRKVEKSIKISKFRVFVKI